MNSKWLCRGLRELKKTSDRFPLLTVAFAATRPNGRVQKKIMILIKQQQIKLTQ